jgi:lipoate-protein ligase A
MDRCLRLPAKQPDYRARRPHLEFVTNLQLEPHRFREELARTWDAGREFKEVPWTKIDELSKQRYQRADWTEKF